MSIEGEINADKLLELWKSGMTTLQIAERMGKPLSVVYRLLRRLEKELVKEKGVENHEQQIHI